jgi:outer membrane protein assembly factor BamB
VTIVHGTKGNGMTRRHSRAARRTACAVVFALAFSLLLTHDRGGPGGPLERADSLEVAWSFRTPQRALDTSDVAATVDDRMLVVPYGRSASVVDTRDGRLLSTVGLKNPRDEFDYLAFSGGVLLAGERRYSDDADADWRVVVSSTMNAYDPLTGRRLWRETTGGGPASGRKGAGAGKGRQTAALHPVDAAPVLETTDGRLVGLAPRTGADRWSRRMPATDPCEDSSSEGSGSQAPQARTALTARHIALLDDCSETAELTVVDARTGRTAWRERLGRRNGAVVLGATRTTVSVVVDGELRVFSETGEALLRRLPDPKSETWPVGTAGDVVYLSETRFDDAEHRQVRSHSVRAVEAGAGRTLWETRQGGPFLHGLGDAFIAEDPDVAGGYSGDLRWSTGDARLQGPGATGLTGLTGKRTGRVPWPVAGTFVGMSGPLFLVRSEERTGTRFTALRPAHRALDRRRPPALGGVEPADWPDACALLSAEDLSRLAPDYVRIPVASSRTVLGAKLPHPSVCRFARESGSDEEILTLTVRWVAPDAEAARTYATSAVPWGCSPGLGGCVTAEVRRPRQGVHLYTYRTGLESTPVAHATVVSGRVVLGISTGTDQARSRQLVRRVAERLSATAPQGS